MGNGLPTRDHSRRAIRLALETAQVFVPSVAAGEIAQKVAAGRLRLDRDAVVVTARDWIEGVPADEGFTELQVSITAALHACELPEPFHKDPADRLIVAMTRLLAAPVVTIDRRILNYAAAGHVAAIAY